MSTPAELSEKQTQSCWPHRKLATDLLTLSDSVLLLASSRRSDADIKDLFLGGPFEKVSSLARDKR